MVCTALSTFFWVRAVTSINCLINNCGFHGTHATYSLVIYNKEGVIHEIIYTGAFYILCRGLVIWIPEGDKQVCKMVFLHPLSVFNEFRAGQSQVRIGVMK